MMKTGLVIWVTCVFAFAWLGQATAREDRDSSHLYFGHIEAPCHTAASDACTKLKANVAALSNCSTIDKACREGTEILQAIFGGTYRPTLADVVVYFQQSKPGEFVLHRPVLIWNGKNTPHLYGVRDVYAVVLTEHRACLSAHINVEYKTEPNPFSAVFTALGKPIDSGQAKPTDKSQAIPFRWFSLSGTPNTPLWMAIAHAKVDGNSTNRMTISYNNPGSRAASAEGEAKPGEECDAAPDSTTPRYSGNRTAANAFFSNSPDSYVTIAAALGVTNRVRDTSVERGGSNVNLNGYGLVKFYLPGCDRMRIPGCAAFGLKDKRPQLRAGPDETGYRSSMAVFVGTNVFNNPLDELVLGVSFGHIVGNVGFIIGVNSIAGQKDTDQPRQRRPFIGLDYSF